MGARRRRRLLVGLLVLVVVVVGVVAVPLVQNRTASYAGLAKVSVSTNALGSTPQAVVAPDAGQRSGTGWRSSSETVGAWIELSWGRAVTIRRIELTGDVAGASAIRAGFLTFGDGSRIQLRMAGDGGPTVIPVSPHRVQRVRLTVSEVAPGATCVTLTRFEASGSSSVDDVDVQSSGDAARAASLTSSQGQAPGLAALTDRDGPSPDLTTAWTLERPVGGDWVQLTWSRPRELKTLSLAGSPGVASLRRATVVFSDSSTIDVGAVLTDPQRPTITSFMPRVTTSLRIVLDEVSGDGPLLLADLGADDVGAPARSMSGRPPLSSTPARSMCDTPPARPEGDLALIVACPANGAPVGDRVDLQVVTSTAVSAVSATIWPSDASAAVGDSVSGAPRTDGTATLVLDTSALKGGPFTVLVETVGGSTGASATVQLDKTGPPAASADAPTVQTQGRSLAFDEEFERPISASASGAGADYAAGKPVFDGVEDFGSAIFEGPEAGLGNIGVVDDGYLRLSVLPRPSSVNDAAGLDRDHVGGLLASARSGGSGVAVQYGYFETRMLTAAAPGTWPAFWMLPAPNLVRPQTDVTEVDAIELYGHDPTGGCVTVHAYAGGKDRGAARCGQRWDTRREALSWHTYGVDVGPTAINFYIDGNLVDSEHQVKGGDEPLFFLLDLSLGGGWPVDLRAQRERADLYVDYVRVYV